MATFDLGQVVGAAGQVGATGNGISSIDLYSTNGKSKTYRITFTNGGHFDFTVTDGNDGSSPTIQTSFGSPTSDSKVPSEKLVKDSLDGKAADTHTHGAINNDGTMATASRFVVTDSSKNIALQEKLGNITLDGKVGTNGNYFVYTSSGGLVSSKQKIGNITNTGAIGTTSGLPIITGTNGVLNVGAFGTSAGTFAEGNHGHAYSDLTNISTVAVIVTYTDNTTETLNLLKYTGS